MDVQDEKQNIIFGLDNVVKQIKILIEDLDKTFINLISSCNFNDVLDLTSKAQSLFQENLFSFQGYEDFRQKWLSKQQYDQIEAFAFFQKAGFRIERVSQAPSFLCHPDAHTWKSQIEHPIYVRLIYGHPLNHHDVIDLQKAAKEQDGTINHAFVIVDYALDDTALAQIGTLRLDGFWTVPVARSLLKEHVSSGNDLVTIELRKHTERFLGQGINPYEVKGSVFDELNFFGREVFAQELILRLTGGRSIGLFGLRKMGKSSLMRYMQKRMPYPTAWVDLQKTEHGDVLRRILQEWQQQTQDRFGIDLGLADVTLSTTELTTDFARYANEAVHKLETRIPGAKLGLFLDEIEFLTLDDIRGSSELRLSLLRTLRGLIQEDGCLALMVAGLDYGINRVSFWGARQNPFFQLLNEIYLPPLAPEDCRHMISNLGRQVDFLYTEEAEAYVVEASGGHPYLARQICSLAYNRYHERGIPVTLTDMEEITRQLLVDPQYTSMLKEGIWEHISKSNLWDEGVSDANQEVLKTLAQSDEPLPLDCIAPDLPDGLRDISLYALQALFIVRQVQSDNATEKRYSIAFSLFKAWLRRRYLTKKRIAV